ncbi:Mbeg1-like protein [Leifsonia sp. NPDC077715]|uniref:Mbeg1-like protein n=1 Tax=Leifsonia sp. NPDC077715 TaxID=3155539 RepID=UPI003424E2C1
MTTDKDRGDIAQAVYELDPAWGNDPPSGAGSKIPPENPKYVFLGDPRPITDPVSGFQAAAIAPILPNKQPDLSHVFVAFAGTNPSHRADINTDLQLVVGGQTAAAQAEQAKAYAEKVRAKYPEADLSLVGHSLGGFLALYAGGELHLPATSFNGPDPWDMLSPEAQAWITQMIAEGKKPLVNYVNEWDAVGNSYGNGTGAACYVRDAPGRGAFEYHNVSSGFHFNPDGSISGSGAKGRSTLEITRNLLDSVPTLYREPMAVMLAGTLGVLQMPGVGRSVAQAVSATLVAMDTLVASSLAARIAGASDLLSGLKDINTSLIPELREGLEDAQRTVSGIPFITARDIEECVIVQRLRVEDNVDEDAVAAVNRRIDSHQRAVQKLTTGIVHAADNAVRQDAQWASTFIGH